MVAVGSGLEARVVREKIDSVAASGAAELVSKPQASWLRERIWGVEGGGLQGHARWSVVLGGIVPAGRWRGLARLGKQYANPANPQSGLTRPISLSTAEKIFSLLVMSVTVIKCPAGPEHRRLDSAASPFLPVEHLSHT